MIVLMIVGTLRCLNKNKWLCLRELPKRMSHVHIVYTQSTYSITTTVSKLQYTCDVLENMSSHDYTYFICLPKVEFNIMPRFIVK